MIKYSYQKDEDEEENWAVYLLQIALWISLFSIVFKVIGYWVYAYLSGNDYAIFDFFYLLLHATADSIVSTLLILLSYGWTVTFVNSRDFDLYIPLSMIF